MRARRTFIYGALLQVRSEEEGGTGVACVGRTDAAGFPAEKRRAAPRFCRVQGEAEQQESEGSPKKPAETDTFNTTQAGPKTGSGREEQEVTLESILKRTATHLIINADLKSTTQTLKLHIEWFKLSELQQEQQTITTESRGLIQVDHVTRQIT